MFYQCSKGTIFQPEKTIFYCRKQIIFCCRLLACSTCLMSSSPSLSHSHLSSSIYIFLHAMSRRTPSEVRSFRVSVSRNYSNPVLIGQWPSRMVGSCCEWRLFMQTGSRVGRPQMGSSDAMRRGKRFYFLHLQLGKINFLGNWSTCWSVWAVGVCVLHLRCELLYFSHLLCGWRKQKQYL